MSKHLAIIFILLIFGISGCSSMDSRGGYITQYYTGLSKEDIAQNAIYIPCEQASVIDLTNDISDTTEFRQGYWRVGTSKFTGAGINLGEADALAAARRIGACRVFQNIYYLETENYTETYYQQELVYVYRDQNGGTQPIYENRPYYRQATRNRYQYEYYFYVKLNPNDAIGVIVDSPPNSYTRRTGNKHGVVITGLMQNSRAYYAGLKEGDIILTWNRKQCTVANFNDLCGGSFMDTNKLSVYRDGKTININYP